MILRFHGGFLVPQPSADGLAPGGPVFVNPEFLRHGITCFGQRGSGSFVLDLSQWGQIAANGEDNGSSAWEAGKGMMLNAQKGS